MNIASYGVLGIAALCCGIYALYSAVSMKRAGVISASGLLGKECTQNRCKDTKAYIRKAVPALIVFGIVAVIYGIIDLVSCYIYSMVLVDLAGIMVFLLVIIGFAVYTTQLKKIYF